VAANKQTNQELHLNVAITTITVATTTMGKQPNVNGTNATPLVTYTRPLQTTADHRKHLQNTNTTQQACHYEM